LHIHFFPSLLGPLRPSLSYKRASDLESSAWLFGRILLLSGLHLLMSCILLTLLCLRWELVVLVLVLVLQVFLALLLGTMVR
jgi:hypothetical protein